MISKVLAPESRGIWRKNLLLLALVIVIASNVSANWVAAGISNTIPKYNFLGGVTAYAQVVSSQSPESSTGVCKIYSYTSPSTTINVIGWTWWQCDRLVNGLFFDHQLFGERGITNSSTQQQLTWPGAFNPPVDGLRSHGVHDFNHNGSNPSPWQPYNFNNYP